ncbi:glycosyltransferase family 4 protein, partial [candidate division WOR-3 bacterium]|nr:glycosyltransferase family 4 protein [candidate division WOR-3 bacterium]
FNEVYDDENGFRTIRIPFLPNSYIPFLPDLPDTDVLWIDEEPVYPQTHYILKKYAHIPFKIIRTLQNIEKKGLYRNYMNKFVNGQVTDIVTIGITSKIVAEKTFNRNNINIVPLSISDRFFDLGKEREINMNDPLVLGFAARLEISKGVLWLMEILEGLEFPFKIIIAGDGSKKDILLSFLEQRNIEFEYRGFIPHSEMDTFYKDIDVFLNTSLRTKKWMEQQGRGVIEAAASGVLVISSDSGELKYVLSDTGITVKEYDSRNFVNAIKEINNDRELLRTKIEKFRKNAVRFSKMHIGKYIYSLIKKYELLSS